MPRSPKPLLFQREHGKYFLILLAPGLLVRLIPAYYVYGSFDVGPGR